MTGVSPNTMTDRPRLSISSAEQCTYVYGGVPVVQLAKLNAMKIIPDNGGAVVEQGVVPGAVALEGGVSQAGDGLSSGRERRAWEEITG